MHFGNWEHFYSGGEIVISGYNNNDNQTTLQIPSEIDGKPVKHIRGMYSNNWENTITVKLVIPATVESLGSGVFSYLPNLNEVEIASDSSFLKNIGGMILSKDGKKYICTVPNVSGKVTVPDGVTTICSGCLSDGVTEIVLPATVTTISERAFLNMSGLKSVSMKDGIQTVGDQAFSGCSALTSLTFGSGLTSIGNKAFNFCDSLTSITLPGTVTSIGASSEYISYDFKFHIPKDSATENALKAADFTNYDYTAEAAPASKTDNSSTSDTSSAGTSPAGTSALTAGASFTSGNANVTVSGEDTATLTAPVNKAASSVKVPNTVTGTDGKTYKVTAIANNAFRNCKNLKTAVIGDNVKTVGKNAFAGCTALKSVTVGKNVTKLGASAFSGSKKLTKIKIKSLYLKSVGKKALKGIAANAKIKVPAKKLAAYKKLFKNKGQGKKVTISK